MVIEFRPIGVIHTPHTEPGDAPIQPSRGRGIRGRVELFPEYVEGLADLDGFSHVMLLYHFHRSGDYRLRVVPFLDSRERGLFATRAPWRPNGIGLSVVRLVAIEGGTLAVEDVDMLDETPLLDIKPYVPEFDRPADVRLGWLQRALDRQR
jgi:tRNA-Thr(GGU) m(6)t(6)A37 methyltransferase TsaA